IAASQQLDALRQLRADWAAIGPGAGLDPLVELELAAAESAAERLALDSALKLIKEKAFERAATELAPLAASRYLPAPVAQAVPGLVTNLKGLAAMVAMNPAPELP